jgi:hypothetical protein
LLDSKAVDLARHQVRIQIDQQNKHLREEIGRIDNEMAARGMLQSGAMFSRISRLCATALTDRVNPAWQSLHRFVTTTGVRYEEGLGEQLRQVIAAA